MFRSPFRSMTLLFALLVFAFASLAPVPWSAQSSAMAQVDGNVPGDSLGNSSDTEFWRHVRKGGQGNVSSADKRPGVLIRSGGDEWRNWRNGPVTTYGIWALAGAIVALLAFYLIRGQIKVEAGLSGRLVRRFTNIERYWHWTLAGSFIVLGLTGLATLYGKHFLPMIIGKEGFASLLQLSKYAHQIFAFTFMIGLLAIIVMWMRDNFWDRYDLAWVLKGGGLFSKGVHPKSRKFNFGQKSQYWMVILGGLAMAATGLNLMFPFLINDLEIIRLLQIAHSIIALLMTMAIMGHIYIGTVGMEAASSAMTSGYVDYNWIKEHHSVWVEEQENAGTLEYAPADNPAAHPAE